MSILQTNSGNSGASYVNSIVASITGVTAGSLLAIAHVSSSPTLNNVSSFVDASGNTWTKRKHQNGSAVSMNLGMDIWVCHNASAGSHSVTINTTDYCTQSWTFFEASAMDLTTANDVEAFEVNANYLNSITVGPTGTPAQADEVVLAVTGYTNSGETISISSGFSNVINTSNATQYSGMASGLKTISSASAQSSTFDSTNYIQHITYIGTFKLAAVTPSTFTKTHTTDSLNRKQFTKTHTSDSFLRKQFSPSHTSDALTRKTTSVTHSSDALNRKQIAITHTTDTLKVIRTTLTYSSDALLSKRSTSTHTSDTYKKIRATLAHTTDSLLFGSVVKTHTTDALLRNVFEVIHTADAYKMKLGVLAHTSDALARVNATKIHTSDALKRIIDEIEFTTDAYKVRQFNPSHTTDSNKRKIFTLPHSTDANLSQRYIVTHSTDAYTVSGEIDTDFFSNDKLPPLLTHSTDTLLTLPVQTDYWKTEFNTSIIQLKNHSTDAQVRKALETFSIAHATDAYTRTPPPEITNNLEVFIDGELKNILFSPLEKEDAINDQADTCEFSIRKSPSKSYKPQIGKEVIVKLNDVKVFGGVIIQVNEEMESPQLLKYRVICKDYTHLLDRKLVLERFKNKTVKEVIAFIVQKYAPEFTINNTSGEGITVQSLTFNRITVSACLQKLAEITNYSWYVDYEKDIHFFSKNKERAPFDAVDGNYIYSSLEIVEDLSQLRNRVIIEGGEAEDNPRTEKLSGDGEKLQFPLTNKFAQLPTVTVNGISKTVGVDYLNKDDEFDCLWSYQEKYIRFTDGHTPAKAENNIVVSGIPLHSIIVQVSNKASIDQYGVYEFVKVNHTIRSRDEAISFARAELEAYANDLRSGSFETYNSGLRSGQIIRITDSFRGLDEDFLIQRVHLKMRSPTSDYLYTVEVATLKTIKLVDVLQQLLGNKVSGEFEDTGLVNLVDFDDEMVINDQISKIERRITENYMWEDDNSDTRPQPIIWNEFTWTD